MNDKRCNVKREDKNGRRSTRQCMSRDSMCAQTVAKREDGKMEDDRQCMPRDSTVCATCCHLLSVQICQTADGWYKFARRTGQRSVTGGSTPAYLGEWTSISMNLLQKVKLSIKNYANLAQVSVFGYSRNKNVINFKDTYLSCISYRFCYRC